MLGASWRTGLVGWIAIASGVAGMIADIIAQQGMPKTIPEYFLFGGLVLGGIGNLLAKDAKVSNSGTNAPAHDVPPVVPVVLLVLLIGVGLSGCASYIDYGGGRYGVTRVSEERSPFGTNAGFAFLENCEGRTDPKSYGMQFSDCHQVSDLHSIQSQGQGGQITAGALQAMGLGILGATMPANGVSATAVQSQSLSGAAPKGHH